MPKTTKAAQKAVNKYIANNYDRVNVTMPKGKKEDYKEGAEAAGKSLNQYIMDCVEEDVEAEKGRVLYTTEMVELMGEVYKGILRVMNPEGHDPYWTISDRRPMKCIVMLLPRATTLGIPKELDEKIAKLMNMISLEDMSTLMNAPMPMEFALAFNKGMMK